LSGTTLYVGGSFTNIGGAARNRIAALDTTVNTNNATAWNPNADGGVLSMALSGTTLYVAGDFTTIGGGSRTGIAALDTTVNTSNAKTWASSFAGRPVNSLALVGTTLYAGGSFSSSDYTLQRWNLMALDTTLDTGNLLSWSPTADNAVQVVSYDGSNFFIGGHFDSIGGTNRTSIAAFDATLNTNNVTAWQPHVYGAVYSMLFYNNYIWAAGGWLRLNANVNRRSFSGFSTLSNTNNHHATCNPAVSRSGGGSAFAVTRSGDTIFVGGDFTNMGGQARLNLGSFTVSTCTMTSWDPNPNSFVRALAAQDDNVFVGGDFTTIGGQSRNYLALIKSGVNTNNATGWNPNPNGSVRSIALDRNYVYIGGLFTTVDGTARNTLASILSTKPTSNLTSWNPAPSGGTIINVITPTVNGVYVGGDFTSYDGSASRVRFASQSCSP
ncbi:hypothetical protein K2X05_09300, partial [bacterium]|nr:hypothetical protein [bacterium]